MLIDWLERLWEIEYVACRRSELNYYGEKFVGRLQLTPSCKRVSLGRHSIIDHALVVGKTACASKLVRHFWSQCAFMQLGGSLEAPVDLPLMSLLFLQAASTASLCPCKLVIHSTYLAHSTTIEEMKGQWARRQRQRATTMMS